MILDRRSIRVKVFKTLYSNVITKDSMSISYKDMELNFDKSHELYINILCLIKEIKNLYNEKIESKKNKRFASKEELNPNTKFLNNSILNYLSDNNELNEYIDKYKINWITEEKYNIINNILISFEKNQTFLEYQINNENDELEILKILLEEIINNEALTSYIEDSDVYWSSDLEIVIDSVVRTLISISKSKSYNTKLETLFKNIEDKTFAKNLYQYSSENFEKYLELIKENSKNWDIERFAVIDKVILVLAITEILKFTSIPVKASMNEYIEIIKMYSTPNSGAFVNGLLDKIVSQLSKEDKIIKFGRGLLNN